MSNLSRRRFLATTGAVAAGAVFAGPAFVRAKNLNDRMNVAAIAVGGRGGANVSAVAGQPNVDITAICDVAPAALGAAAKRFPKARKTTDYRKLFDKPGEFDAVTVSTPEHNHALATMLALKHKKHVYCEKPLTHDIWEARQIRTEAEKAGVATQMGIQIHAWANYRRVVELIRSGAIGTVTEAHVWTSRAWGYQSEADAKKNKDLVYVTEKPTKVDPIPEGFDWNSWLGPAADRPYSSVYFPGPRWYRWWDFGNGTMSDLGSHMNDLSYWALDLKYPKTIESSSPMPVHPDIAPASMQAKYTFDARGDQPAVTLTWYQGTCKPPQVLDKSVPAWGSGTLFVGSEGMLLSDYGRHILLPAEKFADFKGPDPFIPRIKDQNHQAEWVQACASGNRTSANFNYSGLLTEMNHLGNVALRVGKKLEWDPVNLCATNAPEADKYIKPPRRKGWELV